MFTIKSKDNWTVERTEQLRVLWADGLSASMIANEMGGGISRSAVIGKVHRLGLESRRTTSNLPNVGNRTHRPRIRKEKLMARRVEKKMRIGGPNWAREIVVVDDPVFSARAEIDVPLEQRKTLLQLGRGDCRWPYGDVHGPGFYFCGAVAADDQPYCPAHCGVAFIPHASRSGPFGLAKWKTTARSGW